MNANEVKKELYKSKVNAKFSHYAVGELFYDIQLEDGLYQFPIATVETKLVESFHEEGSSEDAQLFLSSDLGQTYFYGEIKASDLNRWIAKAIEAGKFVKLN